MKRKKTRSVASYRAASLKGARTRQQMKEARHAHYLKVKYDWVRGRITPPFDPADYLPNPWFDMVRK